MKDIPHFSDLPNVSPITGGFVLYDSMTEPTTADSFVYRWDRAEGIIAQVGSLRRGNGLRGLTVIEEGKYCGIVESFPQMTEEKDPQERINAVRQEFALLQKQLEPNSESVVLVLTVDKDIQSDVAEEVVDILAQEYLGEPVSSAEFTYSIPAFVPGFEGIRRGKVNVYKPFQNSQGS